MKKLKCNLFFLLGAIPTLRLAILEVQVLHVPVSNCLYENLHCLLT